MSNLSEFSHRRKIIRLPQSAVLQVLLVGEPAPNHFVRRLQPMGLPPTARVVTVHHDFLYDCFVLLVEDESFDEVPEGVMPPELMPPELMPHWCIVETAVGAWGFKDGEKYPVEGEATVL